MNSIIGYPIAITQELQFIDFLIRYGAAILCGLIIGFERQWINRVAGVQTNVLVSSGACLFILSSYFVGYEGQSASRIAAQIVSGVGFLGAGMIFREGVTTHGINTAATIWCCAAVGVLCGMGLVPHALIVTTILIFANMFFRKLDHHVSNNRKWTDLRKFKIFEIEIIPQKNNTKEDIKKLRSQAISIISTGDHSIIKLKNIVDNDCSTNEGCVGKIIIVFKTHTSQYAEVQALCDKIEENSSATAAHWSQNSN